MMMLATTRLSDASAKATGQPNQEWAVSPMTGLTRALTLASRYISVKPSVAQPGFGGEQTGGERDWGANFPLRQPRERSSLARIHGLGDSQQPGVHSPPPQPRT